MTVYHVIGSLIIVLATLLVIASAYFYGNTSGSSK